MQEPHTSEMLSCTEDPEADLEILHTGRKGVTGMGAETPSLWIIHHLEKRAGE